VGTRKWVGIGLLYRPARLHRLTELIPLNDSIPGLLKSLKYRLCAVKRSSNKFASQVQHFCLQPLAFRRAYRLLYLFSFFSLGSCLLSCMFYALCSHVTCLVFVSCLFASSSVSRSESSPVSFFAIGDSCLISHVISLGFCLIYILSLFFWFLSPVSCLSSLVSCFLPLFCRLSCLFPSILVNSSLFSYCMLSLDSYIVCILLSPLPCIFSCLLALVSLVAGTFPIIFSHLCRGGYFLLPYNE
jgi:hypothetical protein